LLGSSCDDPNLFFGGLVGKYRDDALAWEQGNHAVGLTGHPVFEGHPIGRDMDAVRFDRKRVRSILVVQFVLYENLVLSHEIPQ